MNRNYFHLALSLLNSRPAPRQLRNISIQEPLYVPFARHRVAPPFAGGRHCPLRPFGLRSLIAAEQASSVRAYNLPAAPLASTLNQIASQAGLALSLNPSLAAGKTSAPVKGQFDAAGALREALRGTGLQLEQSSAGTYSLVAVPEGVMALAGNRRHRRGKY